MEAMVKKLQKKCREASAAMDNWDPIQSKLLSQFSNAAAIINRLPMLLMKAGISQKTNSEQYLESWKMREVFGPKNKFICAGKYIPEVLREENNYGGLRCIPGIKEAVMAKQMETLEMIFLSFKETMEEFHAVVISLDKIARDASQLLKGGSTPTAQQMQLQIGIRPSLSDCLNGLKAIHEMHLSEYHLKLKVISSLTYKCSGDDIASLRQLLEDQPNIPRDEVQSILDVILAE